LEKKILPSIYGRFFAWGGLAMQIRALAGGAKKTNHLASFVAPVKKKNWSGPLADFFIPGP